MRMPVNDGEDSSDIYTTIAMLEKGLASYSLPENITVYRYTKRKWFKLFFINRKAKKGAEFSDKAFISTTLVSDSLRSFAKEHQYDCLLKLHLPQGTNGVYVEFDKDFSCLKENEFVLPPNLTFTVVKHSLHWFTHIFECELGHK